MLTITSERFGHAVISPTGDFEAGSYQSFEYLYTAGTYGIDDTGGIKIVFRLANDQTRLQFEDPQGPGNTTVELPETVEGAVSYDVKGHKRPWYKVLQVKLVKGNLQEGDTIRVRFGDRRFGGPGIRMQTFCQNDFEFRTFVDVFSNQNYLRLPSSPQIRIVPGKPAIWKAILPTLIQTDDSFRLCLKCEDKWGNPSDKIEATVLLQSSIKVDGLPATVDFAPGKSAVVLEDLSVETSGSLPINLYDKDGELLTTSNVMRVVDNAVFRHFWGDLHGQSRETVGTNTARDYFYFARDQAFLDMTGHQGNDYQITGKFWKHLDQLAAEFHEPGRFVTLPGYEWSGNTGLGGDRNVYFLSEGARICRSCHAMVPDEPDEPIDCYRADILFEALLKSHVPSVAFAHVGGRYADLSVGHDGRIEHAVEIHSAWGTFEWLLHQAFELGHRVGVVCHSDDHKGRPGASYPGASLFGAYGGLTCYLMPELTREALFEAIRRRHHYGTTGARLYMDVRAHAETPIRVYPRDPAWFDTTPEPAIEAIMGDIAQVSGQSVTVSVDIESGTPLERIELYDGTELLETIRFYASEDLGNRIRVIWEGAEYKGRGRITYWNGGLDLKGNAIKRFKPINFWNIEKQPQKEGDRSLAWNSVTTGNFNGVDLWLDDPEVGTLSFKTNQVAFDLPVSEIAMDDHSFDAGGLFKRVRVFRLPTQMQNQAYHFERPINLRPQGDTRIYVKAIFEDGHCAWSSPMYFFN